MAYDAASTRYDIMNFRRSGKSGLMLPEISLGLWHNFGDEGSLKNQRAILRRAFDMGVTHFDLANNYGVPAGSAESHFGDVLASDFKPYRDELLISSKAGWDMWPGPYGQGGGSRKYVLASLDQSLKRMGLDYVDIFYSHRFDPDTPLEETMGALATAVQQGKALYVGISSYSAGKTREAAAILRQMGVPLLIHQPSYSLLNRWVEEDLLDTLQAEGMGCIAFSPLAQGLLTNKYLNGVPADARINRPGGGSFKSEHLSEQNLTHVRALNELAQTAGLSPFHFHRVFKAATGLTPKGYASAHRSRKVRERLADGGEGEAGQQDRADQHLHRAERCASIRHGQLVCRNTKLFFCQLQQAHAGFCACHEPGVEHGHGKQAVRGNAQRPMQR